MKIFGFRVIIKTRLKKNTVHLREIYSAYEK